MNQNSSELQQYPTFASSRGLMSYITFYHDFITFSSIRRALIDPLRRKALGINFFTVQS
jgi:hypothetical protein